MGALPHRGSLTVSVPTVVCCPRVVADVHRAADKAGIEVRVIPVPLECEGPLKSWEEVIDRVRAADADVASVIMLGGSCVAGASPPPEGFHVHRVRDADRCFDLVHDTESVDRLVREGAYLVTPGWLRGWRSHVDGWGFDRGGLREFLRESIRRIVLLDTGADPRTNEALEAMGQYVGLPVERIAVGVDILALRLESVVRDAQETPDQTATNLPPEPKQRGASAADYAMALDLLGRVGGLQSTQEVVVAVLELCELLFRPRWARWVPSQRGARPDGNTTMTWRAGVLETKDGVAVPDLPHGVPHRVTDDGFLVRITYGSRSVGILEVGEVALVDRRVDYANLARGIGPAVGMALANAALIEQIRPSARSRPRRRDSGSRFGRSARRSSSPTSRAGFA